MEIVREMEVKEYLRKKREEDAEKVEEAEEETPYNPWYPSFGPWPDPDDPNSPAERYFEFPPFPDQNPNLLKYIEHVRKEIIDIANGVPPWKVILGEPVDVFDVETPTMTINYVYFEEKEI